MWDRQWEWRELGSLAEARPLVQGLSPIAVKRPVREKEKRSLLAAQARWSVRDGLPEQLRLRRAVRGGLPEQLRLRRAKLPEGDYR